MNSSKLLGTLVLGSALLCSVFAQESSSKDRMWSEKPAMEWQEALLTGNGEQGMMVFGDPLNERVIFNHEKFFEPRRSTPAKAPDVAKHIPKVRELQMAGKYQEASNFYWEKCVEAGHDAILWTEPFHPGYALTIKQGGPKEVRDYRRSCNFETGEVTVQWKNDQGHFVRRAFVSRTDNVMVQEISGSPFSGVLNLESQGLKPYKKQEVKSIHGDKSLDGILTPEISVGAQWMSYRLGYKQTKAGYEGISRVIIDGGSAELTDRGLEVKNAQRILLLTKLVRLDEHAKSQFPETKKMLSALSSKYDELLKPHAAEHGELYHRVSVDLGGKKEDHQLSSEDLIERQKALPEGQSQKALLEKVFNMGRYSLISSSGDFPPNLQAVWNGEFQPAWSGDYTLDANLNLQISAASMMGLPEAIQSYSNLMEKMRPDWQENAKRFYGSTGLMAPARTSGVDGHNYHLSPSFPSGAWTAGGQWLTLPMIESFETTGDQKFLQETVMPFVEGLAQFYVDFLTLEDKEGKVVFSPSYSPEQGPNGGPPMIFNATMDVAAGKECLRYAIKLSEELGVNADKIPTWKTLLEKMPSYRVNEDGALAEWIPTQFKDRYNHRHVSHLYPLWPGHEINPEETPEMFKAAVVAAHKRGRGNGSAHGLSHMALIAARLKQAELVSGNLSFILSKDYLLSSLFTQHNPGWLFNADALHSLPAIVMEMLVYSRPGIIELMPALHDSYPQGKFHGLRTRSLVTIDSFQWDLGEGTASLKLLPLKSQEVTLQLRRGFKKVIVDGQELKLTNPSMAKVSVTKGQPMSVRITF